MFGMALSSTAQEQRKLGNTPSGAAHRSHTSAASDWDTLCKPHAKLPQARQKHDKTVEMVRTSRTP
jgi:hypothetical protein